MKISGFTPAAVSARWMAAWASSKRLAAMAASASSMALLKSKVIWSRWIRIWLPNRSCSGPLSGNCPRADRIAVRPAVASTLFGSASSAWV